MAAAAEASSPTGSLAELRDRHLDLLERWRPDKVEALASEAESLRTAAQALGGWLDEPDERDRAQGIIDYWTAALTGVPGTSFPEILRLAPFDPALPAAEVARAEAILEGHAGTALEADAEEMLLCLVRPSPAGGLVCRAPVERADLIAAGGGADSERRAELLDRFVESGIIRRSADPSGGEDRYAFTHGSTARACPRLRTLVDKRRHMHATRDKLRATAQLWKDSGDSGYLLAGDALGDAAKYLGEDPLLTDFIRVSRRAADRRRLQWLAAGTVGPVLAVVLMFGVYDVSFDRGVRSEDFNQIVRSEAPDLGNAIAAEPDSVDQPTAPTRQRPSLGTPGWIWAGSASQPLLHDPESGRLADLAAVAPGSTWRVRTDIMLRSGPPDADYVSAPQVGIAPAGALVFVVGPVQPFPRPSGVQYWAEVRIVPRVFIHYANARPAQVEPLRGMLRNYGFEAPPVDPVRSAARLREVRYFRKEDAGIAVELARRLAAAIRGPGGAPVAIRCRRSGAGRPDTSHLEIWLDFRGVEVGAPRIDPDAPPVPAPSCT